MTTTTRPSTRWASPVAASSAFSETQTQRVQALRVAREVLEKQTTAGAFATPSRSFDATTDLLVVAGWILDGLPQEAQ